VTFVIDVVDDCGHLLKVRSSDQSRRSRRQQRLRRVVL
jgi:hypothetical protein